MSVTESNDKTYILYNKIASIIPEIEYSLENSNSLGYNGKNAVSIIKKPELIENDSKLKINLEIIFKERDKSEEIKINIEDIFDIKNDKLVVPVKRYWSNEIINKPLKNKEKLEYSLFQVFRRKINEKLEKLVDNQEINLDKLKLLSKIRPDLKENIEKIIEEKEKLSNNNNFSMN